MKRFLLLSCLLAAVSCAPAFHNVSFSNPAQGGLFTGSEILLLTPADGASGTKVTPGSGAVVANRVLYQLKTRPCKVTLESNANSIKEIDDAVLAKYKFVIAPTISNWEDNATAWSGKPCRLRLTFDIYDSNRNLITSSNIDAQGTSVTMSATDPSDLIDKPLKEILDELF